MSMPLTSLFRGSGESKPPEKTDASVVRDCLMAELESQMREAQQARWQKEEEERRKTGVADYRWLASAPPKYYAPPQLQQLQLEELCAGIRPAETGRVINRFREVLAREPPVEEMPDMLRAVMRQVVQERPPEETLGEWVVRRTAGLARTRNHVRVMPLNTNSSGPLSPLPPPSLSSMDQTKQRSLSMPEFSAARARTVQPRSLAEFCTSFDDLPV